MPAYAFIVPGPPQSKERPRLGRGRVYTPTRTKAYEKKVALYAQQAKVKPIVGPVWLTLRIYFPDRRHRDIDNVAKICMDSLNKIAYVDDHHVARLVVEKFYDSGNPRVEIQLESLSQEDENAKNNQLV